MMNLNLYSQLKLASDLSEAIDTNHATHLEHRSLDAILDLISIIRQLQENNDELNKKADTSVRYSGDFYSSTLGYGRKNN
jgi:hypothetical protein